MEEKPRFRMPFRFGLFFLGLLMALVVVSFYRQSLFDQKLGINILLMGKDGYGIVSLNSNGTLSMVRLPDDLRVNLGVGKPEYSLGTLRKTGLTEDDGNNLIRRGVGFTLGVIMPAYLIDRNHDLSTSAVSDALGSWRVSSNLGFLDRYRIKKLVDDSIKQGLDYEVNFPRSIVDVVEDPDGKHFLTVNAAEANWAARQWVNEAALSEAAEIGVANASKTDGAARSAAKQLETVGVRVLAVEKAETNFSDECLLIGEPKSHPMTVVMLTAYLGCKVSDDKDKYVPKTNDKVDYWLVIGDRY